VPGIGYGPAATITTATLVGVRVGRASIQAGLMLRPAGLLRAPVLRLAGVLALWLALWGLCSTSHNQSCVYSCKRGNALILRDLRKHRVGVLIMAVSGHPKTLGICIRWGVVPIQTFDCGYGAG
jgi:hypothetical protein